MERIKKYLLCVLTVALAVLLCGCFNKTVDELYALPRHSDAYNDLQNAIDTAIGSEAVYSAPVSGVNQQSVQLADLDGDGVDEAIAFVRATGEKPLFAYIFDQIDGVYTHIAGIEGAGTDFCAVEYANVDGEAGVEIFVSRQLGGDVPRAMSVYALREGNLVELMSANYSEYTLADLDSDGKRDLFLLRFDAEERVGVAELYRWSGTQFAREPEAFMSVGAESIKRIITGGLSADIPAVFVASIYEGSSIITDVFAFRDSTFCNISSDEGISAQTVRNYFVYASDIDEDGLIELPQIVPLPNVDSSDESHSCIRWFNLDLSGSQIHKLSTYHSFQGGWYLALPENWNGEIAVSRGNAVSGTTGYVFSHYDTQTSQSESVLTVYAFSGNGRNDLASSDGRFILAEKADVTYAAALGSHQKASELSEETVRDMFRFIHIDWNSGER